MEADITELVLLLSIAGLNVVGAVAVYVINKRIKDAQLRDVLANAVRNSVGIGSAVLPTTIRRIRPSLELSLIPTALQPKVEYVLEHAGEAAKRFGVTPDKIAEKVIAQIGLNNPDNIADQLNREEAARHVNAEQ